MYHAVASYIIRAKADSPQSCSKFKTKAVKDQLFLAGTKKTQLPDTINQ
jgi:hypothetical protein